MKYLQIPRAIPMKQFAASKVFLFGAMLLLISSVVIAVVSLYPMPTNDKESRVLIDDTFRLTPLETRREGLGSFRGGENISISVRKTPSWAVNFSVASYNGTRFYNVSTSDIEYSFTAGVDYYDAVFFTRSNATNEVHFEVFVLEPKVLFPFSWLGAPAKFLFFLSIGSALLLLLKPALHDSPVFRADG